jgi:flagellar motor component MotA
MNLAKLQEKLLAAARLDRPSDQVPYAFEQRIMARIRQVAQESADFWSVWARTLWRAATPCLGLTVALVGLAVATGALQGTPLSLGEGLETAVYAVLTEPGD